MSSDVSSRITKDTEVRLRIMGTRIDANEVRTCRLVGVWVGGGGLSHQREAVMG